MRRISRLVCRIKGTNDSIQVIKPGIHRLAGMKVSPHGVNGSVCLIIAESLPCRRTKRGQRLKPTPWSGQLVLRSIKVLLLRGIKPYRRNSCCGKVAEE
jgi:hypothetical protein